MPPHPKASTVRMIEITTLSELTIDGKLALHRASSSKELFDYSTHELQVWFHGAALHLGISRWRMDDWFVKGGIGVSVYGREALA